MLDVAVCSAGRLQEDSESVRIFIDVGAHYGETLHVALDPAWGFRKVILLEPAVVCQALLRQYKDPRISVQQIGLADKSCTATLYGAGLLGGSVYSDKRQIASAVERVEREEINLVRASDWVERYIPAEADVFMKLNCEGSECDILSDLLDTGAIGRVRSLYVDFDVRKIASQVGRQEAVERALVERGISYVTSDSLERGGNAAVRAWLERDCPRVEGGTISKLCFRLGFYAPLYTQFSRLVGMILPRQAYWWLGRRFGRLSRSRSRLPRR